MKFIKLLCMFAVISFLSFVVGCNGSSSSDDGTGTLSLSMTDATTDAYEKVFVTIEEVRVHLGEDEDTNSDGDNGWKVVAAPNQTYDLLELVNGVMADLGTTELKSGHYTQMRLVLAGSKDWQDDEHTYPNYLVDSQGDEYELKVPSGEQTGIKLVHGFDITAGATVDLILDFDVSRSIVLRGDGEYLLKPTIKIIDSLDNALVKGLVTDMEGAPLENARVSAQIDTQDGVEVFTSTLTTQEGAYQMYLPPAAYRIVASKADDDSIPVDDDSSTETSVFAPVCKTVEADFNTAHEIDFSLEKEYAADIEVTVNARNSNDIVTISILEAGRCPEAGEIEIDFISFEGSGDATFSVAGGGEESSSYKVVVSDGSDTFTEMVDVVSETNTVQFDF